MKKELLLNSEMRTGFAPVASTGTEIAGPIFDRTNFLSAEVFASVGAVTGTPTDLDIVVTIYHGDAVDSETTPTSITDETSTTITLTLADAQAGSAEAYINVDLTPLKKWVRLGAVATFTGGTTPAALVNATWSLGDPRYQEAVTDAQNVLTYLDYE